MIFDSLECFCQDSPLFSRYSSSIPRFADVAEFLKRDLSAMPDGRIDIDGNDLYASLATYETKSVENSLFESHDKYVDIQILLAGEELCAVAPFSDSLSVKIPYDEDKDIRFLDSPDSFAMLPLQPMSFAVFFHDDAHMPALSVDAPTTVRKCVIKIRVS